MVLVPLLDFCIRGKLLKCQDVMGIVLALVGVAILEIGPTGGVVFGLGDLLAFGQTIFFGIGYWRLESHSQKHSEYDARLMVGQMVAVAIGAVFFVGVEYTVGSEAIQNGGMGFPTIQQFMLWFQDPYVMLSIVWVALMSTLLPLYLETVALKAISASELTLLMTTVSIWGAGFAYVTLGEVLSMTGCMGGSMILIGCVLGNVQVPVVPALECSPTTTSEVLMDEEKSLLSLSSSLSSGTGSTSDMMALSLVGGAECSEGWMTDSDRDVELAV